MKIKVAINGFGRIGRLFLRSAVNHPMIEIVAINDLTTIETLAHLLEFDSTHGIFAEKVTTDSKNIIINGHPIKIHSEPDPAKLPWGDLKVDVVLESTGRFRKRKDTSKHIQSGAKKVIVSAPADDPDWTVVMGVNHTDYDAQNHNIISNASCTTNCLAPVVKVLLDNFGVERGTMTTIHAYTNDQVILDFPHKDLRRARSAGLSMIPTSTGAAKAVALVLPELKGKLSGMAVRVPTPNVSLVDLVAILNKEATVEQINAALKTASETTLKGILGYEPRPLVSIDFNHDDRSGIVDAGSTMSDGKLIKVLAWYDNEWGYSSRIRDLIEFMYR
jgi:glyceraldehyde 3-phosphate dehydrogenase